VEAADTNVKRSAATTDERRQRVLAGAVRVFAAKGYRGATIADIAEELGFTRAALYYYFGSKLDLLDTIANRPVEMLLAAAREIAALDAATSDKVAQCVASHLRLMVLHPEMFTVMIREQVELPADSLAVLRELNRTYHALLAGLIQLGIDDGSFQDVDADLAALHILGSLNWTLQWYRPDGRLPLEDIIAGYVNLALGGLGGKANRSGE
jgi:AcrR family transcriptional regulator